MTSRIIRKAVPDYLEKMITDRNASRFKLRTIINPRSRCWTSLASRKWARLRFQSQPIRSTRNFRCWPKLCRNLTVPRTSSELSPSTLKPSTSAWHPETWLQFLTWPPGSQRSTDSNLNQAPSMSSWRATTTRPSTNLEARRGVKLTYIRSTKKKTSRRCWKKTGSLQSECQRCPGRSRQSMTITRSDRRETQPLRWSPSCTTWSTGLTTLRTINRSKSLIEKIQRVSAKTQGCWFQ